MSTKAQIRTQAKTPTSPTAARTAQPPVAVPERVADRPDIATQLEGAARLGHSLGAVSVHGSAPPIIQRQEIPDEDEEELQMKREPTAIQRQVPEEEEEELQMKPESAAIQRQELPEEEEEELQMKQEPAAIQRQELPEEEEEELQMKREPAAVQRQEIPEEDEEELMMRRDGHGVGPQGGPVPSDVEAAIRGARGGGQPLEDALQEQMSASLGHDFSGVRVHMDAEADTLNQQLRAKAFTTGQDIFFKRGAYEPGSSSSRELIAHELAHVVQQGTGRIRGGESGRSMAVRPAGDTFEGEADAVARMAGAARPEVGKQSAAAWDQKMSRCIQGKVIQRGPLDRLREKFKRWRARRRRRRARPPVPRHGVMLGSPRALRRRRRRLKKERPVVKPQSRPFSCGPWCVAWVKNSLVQGRNVEEPEVIAQLTEVQKHRSWEEPALKKFRSAATPKTVMGTELGATTADELIGVLTRQAPEVSAQRAPLSAIWGASKQAPRIVLWTWREGGGHWNVVAGARGGNLEIQEPSPTPEQPWQDSHDNLRYCGAYLAEVIVCRPTRVK